MKPFGEIYTWHLNSLAKHDIGAGATNQQIDNNKILNQMENPLDYLSNIN
jgi:hypothetical protein